MTLMGHIFTYPSYKQYVSEAQSELMKQRDQRTRVIPEEPKCDTAAPLPGCPCAGQMNPNPGRKGPDAGALQTGPLFFLQLEPGGFVDQSRSGAPQVSPLFQCVMSSVSNARRY